MAPNIHLNNSPTSYAFTYSRTVLTLAAFDNEPDYADF